MIEYIFALFIVIVTMMFAFLGGTNSKITPMQPSATVDTLLSKKINTRYKECPNSTSPARQRSPKQIDEDNTPPENESQYAPSKHTSQRKVRFSSRRKERFIAPDGKIIDRVGKT